MWIEKIQAAAYNGASMVVSEFDDTHHFEYIQRAEMEVLYTMQYVSNHEKKSGKRECEFRQQAQGVYAA